MVGGILDIMLAVQFHAPTWGLGIGIVVLLGLLLTSAFISGSESACFSLKPKDLEHMRRERASVPAYGLALSMLECQDRLLATILITNNLVNIGVVILSAYITDGLVSFAEALVAGFIVKVVLITFLILLFGEVLPKLLGTARPVLYLRKAARPLYFLYCMLKPFSILMARSVSRINQRLTPKLDLSMEELGEALDITQGHLPEEEAMLKRIVHYGDIEVSEIMKPRMDVIAVDVEESYAAIRVPVLASGYSRIPAYRGSLDQVEGVLYVKDMLPYIDETGGFDWVKLLRPSYFVPENKKIDDLLKEFQEQKIHMAIVVDEYGGTCGIITLDDILEEVFGEIGDEGKHKEDLYRRLGERSIDFEAKIQINDLCKVLGIDDAQLDEARGESETLAGLVLELLGRFPEVGEVIKVQGLTLTVEVVDARRIERIRVDY